MHTTPLHLTEVVSRYTGVSEMASKSMPHFVRHLEADNGSLLLLAGNEVTYKLLATKETFTEVSAYKVRTVLSDGMAAWTLRHRQGGLASDTALDERWISMGDTSIASALVVPMMGRGAVIGLLSFHHATRGFFRESHLARAAELAQLVAPHFDLALQTESSLASLVTLCQSISHPSVVLDWHEQVQAINPAMQALDLIWDGGSFTQSLLPRELNADSVRACTWEGPRALSTLPWLASVVPFRDVGLWIQLQPNPAR